jgi:hypothetical protein
MAMLLELVDATEGSDRTVPRAQPVAPILVSRRSTASRAT